MKKEERQKRLDEAKWLESEKAGKDTSGVQEYCLYCKKRNKVPCDIPQDAREKDGLCATAYNRMLQITARLRRGK